MPSWLWSNTLRLCASHVGGAACGLTARSCRRAASKRPLSVHCREPTARPSPCVQIVDAENYVTLPLARQVMGQHADGRASQPHTGYRLWVYRKHR